MQSTAKQSESKHSPESKHESGSLSSTAALPTSSARLISYVVNFLFKMWTRAHQNTPSG